MYQYFQALILTLGILGCAHSADGKGRGNEASEPLVAGESAIKVPSSSKETPKKEAPAPKTAKANEALPDAEVSKLIKRYKTETPVQVKIRKRVQSPYLVKEKVSSGELKLDKDIFRLDLDKPDDSTMVLDGKNIWLETRLDPSMGGEVQVSKFSMNDTRRANAVFAILFDGKDLNEGFHLKQVKDDDSKNKTFIYEPKKTAADYKRISISISPEKKQLVSFSYEDDLENVVIYDFGKTTFNAKIRKWQLEYTPPKGVKPSEFN